MRQKILTSNISFGNGRAITITGEPFTAEQVCLVYNETQDEVLISTGQRLGVTVVDTTIFYPAPIPALVVGDLISVEIDRTAIPNEYLAIEVFEGKKTLAAAINTMGQASTVNDSFDQMALKVKAISTVTTVIPLQGLPEWHDLAYEIAQWSDVDVPFRLGILLIPGIKDVALQGAQKYKTSDGFINTSSQGLYTIGANEVGRELKTTKFIIFGFSSPVSGLNFSSYPYIGFGRKILQVYNYGCDMNAIYFNGVYPGQLVFDSNVKSPIIFNSTRYKLSYSQSTFFTVGGNIIMPAFTADATSGERTLSICLQTTFSGNYIVFPSNIYSLTLTGVAGTTTIYPFLYLPKMTTLLLDTSWANMTTIVSLIIDTVNSLTINTCNNSQGSTFGTVYIAKPLYSFTQATNQWLYVNTISSIELGAGWNFTINLNVVISKNVYSLICQKLVDYRAIPALGAPTLQTSTANNKCYGTNTQFTKVHHAGEVIYVNAVAKTISSIQSDTELTMSSVGSSTASGLSYGMNKTLTLEAGVKTALTSSYPTWQTDLQAAGWTIA